MQSSTTMFNFARLLLPQKATPDQSQVKFMKIITVPAGFVGKLGGPLRVLLLCTDLSMQMWHISNEEPPTCLLLRKIPEICMLDLLYAEHLGYITFENKTQLTVFSLKSNCAVKTFATPCPIRKFLGSGSKILVLQLDGTMQILNHDLDVLLQLKTFQVQMNLLRSLNNSDLRDKTDLLLSQMGFPIDISLVNNSAAFIYSEINEQTIVENLLGQFNQTSFSKNIYIKEAASKLINIGNQSVEAINKLIKV